MTEEQGAAPPAPVSSPEQASGLVNDQGAAAPEQPNAAVPEAPEGVSERAQKRFEELSSRVKEEAAARHALELEIAELRGRVSQGEQVKDEWSEFSDEELLTISIQEGADSTQKAEALRRYHARQNEKFKELERMKQDNETKAQLSQEISKTWEGIVRDFGPEANNQGSELYKKAHEVYSQYREAFGADKVDTNPSYQRMAFEVAHSQVSSPSNQRIAELEAELAKYKQSETIEAAGNLASSHTARDNQAIRGGDIKAKGVDLARRLLSGPPMQ